MCIDGLDMDDMVTLFQMKEIQSTINDLRSEVSALQQSQQQLMAQLNQQQAFSAVYQHQQAGSSIQHQSFPNFSHPSRGMAKKGFQCGRGRDSNSFFTPPSSHEFAYQPRYSQNVSTSDFSGLGHDSGASGVAPQQHFSPQNSVNGEPVCYRCGYSGHLAYGCRVRLDHQRQSLNFQ